MPQPPSLRKINPAEGSILLLNVSSKTLPLRVVNQYVEDLLIGKLSSVDGVACESPETMINRSTVNPHVTAHSHAQNPLMSKYCRREDPRHSRNSKQVGHRLRLERVRRRNAVAGRARDCYSRPSAIADRAVAAAIGKVRI